MGTSSIETRLRKFYLDKDNLYLFYLDINEFINAYLLTLFLIL